MRRPLWQTLGESDTSAVNLINKDNDLLIVGGMSEVNPMHPREAEKKTSSAVENAEINDYIKSYLKYNKF